VTPNGLSFGNMNGMRPRGVVLNEGTLRGDTLSGRQRWGGITFNDIPGAPKMEPGFSFVRVR